MIPILLILVVGLAATAGAHDPAGEVFHAVQFPDEAVPVIDGNLDDWALVPEKYSIRTDTLFSPDQSLGDVDRGGYDPDDINIWHRVGFSATTGRLYFSSTVFDDYHSSDREDPGSLWLDDSWEVRINASMLLYNAPNEWTGPPFRFIYSYAVPPREGIYQRMMPGEEYEWMLNRVEFGWSFTGAMTGTGGSTYVYELSTTPVMTLYESANETEFLDVEEGTVVHFNIGVIDVDGPGYDLDGYWTVSPGPGNHPWTDLQLAELEDVWSTTSVADISWGMIKAGLAE